MKAEIYQWVRILATFYILFTAVLQLMPDRKYERYIRSFMGLLLIYMLCTPLFSFLRGSREMIGDFADYYNEEVHLLEQKETQDLQGFYIRKGFRQELASQIAKKCEDAGIKIQETIVDIEGETISVELKADQNKGGAMINSGRASGSKSRISEFLQKGMTKQQWIVILLLGLLLSVIALPVSKKSSTPKQTILMDNSTQSTDEIQSSLERRLQNILENVEGVGEVKVMLMTEEQQGIYRSGETEVRGVLIAAEGASDPVVVQKIQQAVMALFQIEAHKIKIMKMK